MARTAAAATGIVQNLTADKGFGFIRADDGNEYFFHRSGVTGEGGYDALRKGQAVTFTPTDAPKGPRAENVSAK